MFSRALLNDQSYLPSESGMVEIVKGFFRWNNPFCPYSNTNTNNIMSIDITRCCLLMYLFLISASYGQGKTLNVTRLDFTGISGFTLSPVVENPLTFWNFTFYIFLFTDLGFLCEDGWLLYRAQCYLYSNDAQNWYKARQICQDLGLGADLAQVRDVNVDNFLFS